MCFSGCGGWDVVRLSCEGEQLSGQLLGRGLICLRCCVSLPYIRFNRKCAFSLRGPTLGASVTRSCHIPRVSPLAQMM